MAIIPLAAAKRLAGPSRFHPADSASRPGSDSSTVSALSTQTLISGTSTVTTSFTAPRLSGITPDNGFSATDAITNVNRVTIRGSGTAGSRVQVSIDGVSLAIVSVTEDGLWQYTPPSGVSAGLHAVTIVGISSSGVRLAGSNSLNILIDQTGPNNVALLGIGSDTGVPGDLITQAQRLTLSGTAEAGSRVTLRVDGVVVASFITGSTGNWTFALRNDLSEAAHQISVRAEDIAGNTVTKTYQVVVDQHAQIVISSLNEDADAGLRTVDAGGTTNNEHLLVGGTVESGSSLTLTVTGPGGSSATVPASAVSISGASWSAALDLTSLFGATPADGTYVVTAKATDIAGNTGTQTRSFILDNAAPPVGIVSLIDDAGSVTGAIPAGGITDDRLLTLNGTVETGASINASITSPSGTTLALPSNAIVIAGSNWTASIDLVSLFGATPSDGAYTVSVTARDAAGNASTAATRAFVLDTTAPAVTIVNVTDDAGSVSGNVAPGGRTDDETLAVSGTIEAGSSLTLSVTNGTVSVAVPASAVTINSGNWTANIDLTTLGFTADGTYTIRAVATDAAGNSSTVAARDFILDNAPPMVTLIDITDDSGTVTGVVPAGGNTDDETLGVRGTIEAGATLSVTVSDGTTTAIVPASAVAITGTNWTANVNLTTLGFTADGTYTLSIVAIDAAGNASTPVRQSFILDNSAPTLSIIDVVDDAGTVTGSVGAGLSTDDETLALTGTLDVGATISVSISNGTTSVTIPAVVDSAGTNWSANIDLNALGFTADGTYTISAVARDIAGNARTLTRTFILDNTPPPASFNVRYDPTPADYTSDDTTPIIQGTTEAGSKVEFLQGSTVLQSLTAGPNGSWLVDYSFSAPLALGDYTIRITDPAGNSATRVLHIVASTGPLDRSFSNDVGISHALSWGDYDGDGRIDYYAAHNDNTSGLLYRNTSTGFVLQPSGTLPSDQGYARSAMWIDFDGDGDLDLFSTRATGTDGANPAQNRLYRNDGNGVFSDAGALLTGATAFRSLGASWGDYDRDGDLDLFVANFSGQSQIWTQAANGTFTATNIDAAGQSYRAGNFIDFDRDGDMDLLILRDNGIDLFRNEAGVIDNTADSVAGLTGTFNGFHLGWAWADYNNDGRLDAFVTTYSGQSFLLTQQANGTFSSSNLGGSTLATSAQWVDYDHDGDLDLYVTNGNAQQNLLWRNNGGSFTQDNILGDTGDSANAQWIDFDYDGDLDLSVANYSGNRLFETRNTPPAGSYLVVSLTAADGGQDVNGAIIVLRDAGGTVIGTRLYEPNQPTYFYNLTNQNYSISIEYGGATITHAGLNPTDAPAVHLSATSGGHYSSGIVNMTATGYDEIFRPENDGTVLRIAHFEAGNGGDRLDIGDLLSGYLGGNSLANLQSGGFVELVQNGSDVTVRLDANGGGDQYIDIALILNTRPVDLTSDNFIV